VSSEEKRKSVRVGACFVEFGFANSQSVEAFEEAIEIVRGVRDVHDEGTTVWVRLDDALKLLEQAWDGIVAGTAGTAEPEGENDGPESD